MDYYSKLGRRGVGHTTAAAAGALHTGATLVIGGARVLADELQRWNPGLQVVTLDDVNAGRLRGTTVPVICDADVLQFFDSVGAKYEERIANLKEEEVELARQVAVEKSNADTLKAGNNRLLMEVARLEAQADSWEESYARLTQGNEALLSRATDSETERITFARKSDALSNEIATLKSANEALRIRNVDACDANTDLEAQLRGLKKANSEFVEESKRLETRVAVLESDRSRLLEKNELLTKENTELRNTNSDLAAENRAASSVINRIKAECTSVSRALALDAERVAKLEARYAELEMDNGRLVNENASLGAGALELREQYGALFEAATEVIKLSASVRATLLGHALDRLRELVSPPKEEPKVLLTIDGDFAEYELTPEVARKIVVTLEEQLRELE